MYEGCLNDVAMPENKLRGRRSVYDGDRSTWTHIPENLRDEVRRLLEKDVRVYVLTGIDMPREAHEAEGLMKSDENNATSPEMIPLTLLRKLVLDRLHLEEDAARYRRFLKAAMALKNG